MSDTDTVRCDSVIVSKHLVRSKEMSVVVQYLITTCQNIYPWTVLTLIKDPCMAVILINLDTKKMGPFIYSLLPLKTFAQYKDFL